MKVIINRCHGGYGLSPQAHQWLLDHGATLAAHEVVDDDVSFAFSRDRSHPLLVGCVEALGAAANGPFAALVVVEVPDGVDWVIAEHGGLEWVAERHRTWGSDVWPND